MDKKTALVIRLVLLIVLFFLVCGIALTMFLSESKLLFTIATSASENEYREESQSFSNVKTVNIDTVSYQIDVIEYDGDKVTVQEDINSFTFASVGENKLWQEGDTVYYEQAQRIGILNFDNGTITVFVPIGTVLEYNLCSVSGSIELDAPSTDSLLTSTSGSIKAYQGGNRISAVSTSGSVKVYEPFDVISATSVSGSIKVAADVDTTSVDASSTSGSVKISLDGVTGYKMIYSSVSGSVKDEYSDISYGKNGSTAFGDESLMIEAKSTSGSISLEDWQ